MIFVQFHTRIFVHLIRAYLCTSYAHIRASHTCIFVHLIRAYLCISYAHICASQTRIFVHLIRAYSCISYAHIRASHTCIFVHLKRAYSCISYAHICAILYAHIIGTKQGNEKFSLHLFMAPVETSSGLYTCKTYSSYSLSC